MQKVSSLVSASLGDTLTNIKTWKNVMYNALENGLVGDGITNDTAALQTLINTAIAAGRRTIFFPHTDTGGTYYVTALTNAGQVDFIGDNSSFVGGYTGTISDLGGFAALEAEFTQLETDYAKEVAKVFNVVGYGADPTGVADSTSTIQAAVTAAVTAGGGIVYFPKGTYKTTITITISGAVIRVEGAGRGNTTISYTGPDDDAFEVGSDYCEINNLKIIRSGTPTSGSGVKLINNAANCTFDNLTITGFFYGLDALAAKSWNLTDSYLFNNLKYEVYIRNTSAPDSGDQVIQGCTFDSSIGTDAAIRHESGGGVKITDNKILRHGIGYDLQVADGATTSVAIIDGNSIEMQTVRHIRIGRLATTGSYTQIVISNNQHNFATSITEGYLIQVGVGLVVINGNVTSGYSSAPFINITGGSDINVDGNQINNWQIGIKIAVGLNGIRVGPNNYIGVSKPIEDNTLATSGTRPPLVDHLYIKKFTAITSDTVYTNLFRIDMQTYRSCTLELTFEGILAGVTGIGRHIKQVVTRSAGNATETSVSDTNGGAVIDVQFDNATTAGSVIIGIRRNTAAGGTQLDGTATIRLTGHVQGMNIL